MSRKHHPVARKISPRNLKREISGLVAHIKAPRTAAPEKEVPAVVAELVRVFDRLNQVDTTRQDWMAA